MLRFICLAVAVSLVSGLIEWEDMETLSNTQLVWQQCRDFSGPTSPLQLTHFELSPYPLKVPSPENDKVHITVNLENNRNMADLDFDVTVQRLGIFGWYDIECGGNEETGQIGSCHYRNVCSRMTNENAFVEDIVNMLNQNGMPESKRCPFKSFTFEVENYQKTLPVDVGNSQVLALIASTVGEGKYYVKNNIRESGSNAVIGCYEAMFKITA